MSVMTEVVPSVAAMFVKTDSALLHTLTHTCCHATPPNYTKHYHTLLLPHPTTPHTTTHSCCHITPPNYTTHYHTLLLSCYPTQLHHTLPHTPEDYTEECMLGAKQRSCVEASKLGKDDLQTKSHKCIHMDFRFFKGLKVRSYPSTTLTYEH